MATKTVVNLTTAAAVREYFSCRSVRPSILLPQISEVIPLKGGGVNFTYRLHFQGTYGPQQHKTAIFKHATDYIAATPDKPFSRSRLGFEACALKEIAPLLPREMVSQKIKLPQLLEADIENGIIIMEDVTQTAAFRSVQSLSLKDFCKASKNTENDLNFANEIGSLLGTFLEAMHSLDHRTKDDGKEASFLRRTFSSNAGAREICAETAFGDFLRCLDILGVDLPPERRSRLADIMFDMEKMLLENEDSLVMGDFWTGNVLMTLANNNGNNSPLRLEEAYIIDWEFVTYAPRYIDLAHFASEAWLYDHFYPSIVDGGARSVSRCLTSSMFRAYRSSGASIDLGSVICYIGGHIVCFLAYFKGEWTSDESFQNATALAAVELIEMVHDKDWDGLRKSGFLAGLFE